MNLDMRCMGGIREETYEGGVVWKRPVRKSCLRKYK